MLTKEQTVYLIAMTSSNGELASYYRAMKCPDADFWLVAIYKELRMFDKIGLYEEVNHPPEHKIIDLKWVFKIK